MLVIQNRYNFLERWRLRNEARTQLHHPPGGPDCRGNSRRSVSGHDGGTGQIYDQLLWRDTDHAERVGYIERGEGMISTIITSVIVGFVFGVFAGQVIVIKRRER